MDVRILSGLKGAKKAEGLTVIIDVFRSSTTILAALSQNAKKIIPVESIDKALFLKKQYPSFILVGERKGKKIQQFEYGNSPATMKSLPLDKKTIILSTSSGTKGICNAKKSTEILIAGFSNISKMISYINNKNPNKVSLIPMGLNVETSAIEDELCAQFIKKRLHNEIIHYQNYIELIMNSPGIKRLKRLGQQKDISYCLTQDIFPILASYDPYKKTITQIKINYQI